MRYPVALAAVLCLVATLRAEEPSFPKEGLAFVQKHCIDCHNADTSEGSLDLEPFTTNESLIKGRKQWEKILDRVQGGEMPPEKQERPTVAEINGFVQIVQGLFDKTDREAKPDPGRVTARRLNRAEYANTIRDLLGVDFDPTADFPSDDIGHGFDNIGDVLTLPPVLMERYLAAAEQISERAIVTVPPTPPTRRITERYMEPEQENRPRRQRRRVLDPEKTDSPEDCGPFHAGVDLDSDEEYLLRVRVAGEAPKEHVLQIAFLACGEGHDIPNPASEVELQQLVGPELEKLKPVSILKIFDVTNRDPNDTDPYEVKVSKPAGIRRLAVAMRKWPEGQPAPKLHVESFEVHGPLDFWPESHRKLLACTPDTPLESQTREVVTRFVKRAYRRPGTPAEIDRLVQLAMATVASGEKWEFGIRRAMQAVLISPKFLFRVETDGNPEAPETRPLDEFQLASRLSYFLWSSMPDDELLDFATRNELTPNLEPQVRRMLKDPKAEALVQNFGMQWLQLQRLRLVAPDTEVFPMWDDRLRRAMARETELFLAEIVREDRSLLDLVDADFTYLNEPLARLYDIYDTKGNKRGEPNPRPGGDYIRGDDFVRVSLGNKERGGLLTQASVLTVTSNPTRTSPVKRGRWILEQVLGTPPPPPPPNVPQLEDDKKAQLTGSLRQRLEQHRAKPECANCHARMDPIGFALESYDAIGRFRTKDGEFPIETADQFSDGTKFADALELKTILRETRKEQVRKAVTEKMLIYALGRGLEYYDRPTQARIAKSLNGDDRFSRLVIEIVKSEPFRLRRGL